MPLKSYFDGNGREVWASMVKEYGRKRAQAIFYATANAKGQAPKRRAARSAAKGS